MKILESMGFVTPKDYSAYVKFHVLRGKNYRLKTIAIVAGLLLFAAALLVIGLLTQIKGLWIAAGAIVLCLIMFVYTINVNVKRICNSQAKTVRAKQHVVFGKDGFVLELLFQNPDENEFDEIFYDELEKVYVAKNAVYLYIEKRSVIILPKRNLNMSSDEAKAFLEKYIPAQLLVICR